MAVSKSKGLVGRSLVVIIAVTACWLMPYAARADALPCGWSIKLLSGPACTASSNESFRAKCDFLEVLTEELCQSALRQIPLNLDVHLHSGADGNFVRIVVTAAWRSDELRRRVVWSRQPAKEDFTKDAKDLVQQIVEWLKLNQCPAKPPPFLDA
ncbi:hypothetical protein A2936_00595 [Candidatus Uhrbacteria bacterium RIFCSPLOWO2_01_FULL_47_25]|uniref:Uncharacterized protein n=1 Tax=Candidatus Uhrbacteria bacterium RIFCSPLOWO2_01_FULL_47_25 TaxID=1802402 RepID=A0A1F7UTU8_9BACT|nr:MAG: hypothetical protein UX68_C0042G0007 [Parcubacteria group bacterium GW2011_GWA2_46_9]OGL81087.1 MAG: hypothetical protein A2936_00595 [Candidatus Uhrbacteria bacterium RIFCSPLOWO2_01_FULL_47_25]OGL86400.1 MAG: hypothetical protein A3I37_01870 [Candidatus Uhrbacteria bacterium RIFCSPLOWO2_02_FULL_46_19]